MTKVFLKPIRSITRGALLRTEPVYVQFYVTARCNLRCKQCNIIYANADQKELGTEDSLRVIEKLAEIGTSVVLLTGGEPFLRNDLPELVSHCIKLGIHPRLQTNGLASRDQLEEVVKAGANDISISLDTLIPSLQDSINGEFENSFDAALDTISKVNEIFPTGSFAALGCVFSPANFRDVPKLIEFATQIGWWVSLVPAHATESHLPRAFSSFDSSLIFSESEAAEAKIVLQEVRRLKSIGKNVYDSEQYLDDIYRFITNRPVTWRDRNGGICDAPTSYFAITPNGNMSVCCDFRMPEDVSLLESSFKSSYKSGDLKKKALPIISGCSGCMYGSFPEITTSLRFASAAVKRLGIFLGEKRATLVRYSPEQLRSLAAKIQKG